MTDLKNLRLRKIQHQDSCKFGEGDTTAKIETSVVRHELVNYS